MRKNVYVVWIDDEQSPFVKGLKRIVRQYIENKGYSFVQKDFSSIEEANNYFTDSKNKVDLFVIDYNIGGPNRLTGFDYLSEVRRSGKHRQYFILYSNNNEEVLKDELSSTIKNKELSELSNFEIISLEKQDEKNTRFEKAIDIALSWWDELNALRGIITSENGKYDYYARKLLESAYPSSGYDWFDYDDFSYKRIINKVKRYCRDNSLFSTSDLNAKFDEWQKLRLLRNDCAHAIEKFDETCGKYYLENPITGEKIYDSDLLTKRLFALQLSATVETIVETVRTNLGCLLPTLV